MEQQKNTVAVMMSTYNGAPYLEEQILSILRQSAVEVRLFIRDDGSTDDTVHILERYASHAQVTVKCGANLGIGRSFMELLYSVPEDCDYYAYLKGDPNPLNQFRGEYMSQYDFAESTRAYLERKYYE